MRITTGLTLGLMLIAGAAQAQGPDKAALTAAVAAQEAMLRADPQDVQAMRTLGIALHDLAILKLDSAAARAVETLSAATAQRPGDAEALAYLGSAYTMTARDSWNPMVKIGNVNKGTALLDKAVRLAPDAVAIRLVRGINAYNLPAMFDRRPVAVEDLTYVATRLGTGNPALLADVCGKLSTLGATQGTPCAAPASAEAAR